MAKYFNTAFSLSMVVPPFSMSGSELTPAEAAKWLNQEIQNVANPNHANTLDAVSKKLGADVRDAKGGRVVLNSGDECLVAQVSFPRNQGVHRRASSSRQILLRSGQGQLTQQPPI